MEIRASAKDCKNFKKLNKKNIEVTEDNSISVPVMMVHEKGRLVEWTKGRKEIQSFLKYGFVRMQKDCPYRFGKCIAEKCSKYVIQNGTGDCADTWTAILLNSMHILERDRK